MKRVKSITTKYIFLGLIALGLIASFISLSFWFTNHIKDDARRINLAGKQRMLSYEMAWLLNPVCFYIYCPRILCKEDPCYAYS